MKAYKAYLVIKNAIIAFLLTMMYTSWLIEGLRPIKIVVACIVAFVAIMSLLRMADRCYMRANAKKCCMKKVEKNQALISKEELDALILIASSRHAQGESDEKRDEAMSLAAFVSITIEEHIWGNKQIPEETVLRTIDYIRRARKEEERGDLCGQARTEAENSD